MSLINCPECGKEISDKAVSCPNCGNPMQETTVQPVQKEEYLCCPKCMSRELHTEQKGFSGGKALVGGLLTGGIGLLAGTIGSKDVAITCLKCGNKFKAGEAKVVNSVQGDNDIEKELLPIIQSGNMLQAVKMYKDRMNVSLAEAKSKVDAMKAKHNIVSPTNSGCAGMIVLFIVVGGLLSVLI